MWLVAEHELLIRVVVFVCGLEVGGMQCEAVWWVIRQVCEVGREWEWVV